MSRPRLTERGRAWLWVCGYMTCLLAGLTIASAVNDWTP